jgi:NitT/TauT family transport system substrate-binding protein
MGHPKSRGLLPLLAGALLLGCSRQEPAQLAETEPGRALTKVTLSTDWYPEAEQGGFYQALAKGYYRDAGLDVTILPGGPGSFPVQALALGRVQFSLAASDEVIMDVSHNIPLVIVGAFLEHYPEALLIHTESPIKSFADLNGTTVIGVPGAGWIANAQRKYGIKFSVVPMGFEIQRFLSDPTVVQQCYITNEPYYVRKAGVKARTILMMDSGYDPYRVIIVARSFLHDHPETVKSFVAASLRGWKDFASGDASPGVDAILQRNSKTTRDFVEASVTVLRDMKIIAGDPARGEYVGKMTPDRLRDQIRMMADIHEIDAPYPLENLASFDFSP